MNRFTIILYICLVNCSTEFVTSFINKVIHKNSVNVPVDSNILYEKFLKKNSNDNEISDLQTVKHPKKVSTIISIILSMFINQSPTFAAEVIAQIPQTPTDADNKLVQMAFTDFDAKKFTQGEKEVTQSIKRWRELNRPRDEIVSLIKLRANLRLDNKDFLGSLADCNEALQLMNNDGEKPDGTALYPEYPDTFVSRALAEEGLANWDLALKDYDKAISLWGGGRGDGINPYVLTFRGNTLTRLNRYADAIDDYEAASNSFNLMRNVDRYSDARANEALALYEVGRTDDALKAMKDVIRKNPGFGDMRVAIAADAWSKGDYIVALKVSC